MARRMPITTTTSLAALLLLLSLLATLVNSQQVTLAAPCFGDVAYCAGSGVLLTCIGQALVSTDCLILLTTPSEGASCTEPAPTAGRATCVFNGVVVTEFPLLSGGLSVIAPGGGTVTDPPPGGGGSVTNPTPGGGTVTDPTPGGGGTVTPGNPTPNVTPTPTPSVTSAVVTITPSASDTTTIVSTITSDGSTFVMTTAIPLTSTTSSASSSSSGASSSSSSGLSTGAKAGIGAGVAVGAVVVIGLLAFCLVRRRSKKNDYQRPSTPKDDRPTDIPPVAAAAYRRKQPPRESWGGAAEGGALAEKNPDALVASHPAPEHESSSNELADNPIAAAAVNRRSDTVSPASAGKSPGASELSGMSPRPPSELGGSAYGPPHTGAELSGIPTKRVSELPAGATQVQRAELPEKKHVYELGG